MENRKVPTINESNLIYLILGILMLTVGSLIQTINLNIGLIVTEYLLILLPVIVFLRDNKYSIRGVLRLNFVSINQLIFVFFIIIFSYPIAVFLNFIVSTIIGIFTDATNTGVPIPTSFNDFLVSLFVIGVTPGICEEVLFRGLMLNSYEKLGKRKAIIITSILFGLFHFNLFNFIGPVFLGIILGIVYFKADSIVASMWGHFVNNSFSLAISYFAMQKIEDLEDIVINNPEINQSKETIITIIVLFIISIISAFMLRTLLVHFPEKIDKTNNNDQYEQIENELPEDALEIEKIKLGTSWDCNIDIYICKWHCFY
jgi:CAAX amino terminal protease family.